MPREIGGELSQVTQAQGLVLLERLTIWHTGAAESARD